jgi:hypothetical protein
MTAVQKGPADDAAVVDGEAARLIDPGGSKVVKFPWLSSYPWSTPEESTKSPTMSPISLSPRARVRAAPGKLMAAKLKEVLAGETAGVLVWAGATTAQATQELRINAAILDFTISPPLTANSEFGTVKRLRQKVSVTSGYSCAAGKRRVVSSKR